MTPTTLMLGLLATLSAASPFVRATDCSQYGSTKAGNYTVYNDLWGKDGAVSGSQCYSIDGTSDTSVSWETTWTWQGGSGVKSYANAVVNASPKALSAIPSMQSSWSWTYAGSNLDTNVAYDLFTSSSPSGSNENEIMIWLASLGAVGPISSSYDSSGKPVPVASPTIGGRSFKLYKGSNGSNIVFSFVAKSQINSFSGDVKEFLDYLISHQGLSASQYLISSGAGTEATSGSNAKFTVKNYSLAIS